MHVWRARDDNLPVSRGELPSLRNGYPVQETVSDPRAHLQALAEALPPDSVVPVPVAWLRELLAPGAALPVPAAEPGRLVPDLTCREAAAVLGRHESTVRAWLEAGELEGYKQRGREWRVTPAALERFRERERTRESRDKAKSGNASRRRTRVNLGAWRGVRRAI